MVATTNLPPRTGIGGVIDRTQANLPPPPVGGAPPPTAPLNLQGAIRLPNGSVITRDGQIVPPDQIPPGTEIPISRSATRGDSPAQRLARQRSLQEPGGGGPVPPAAPPRDPIQEQTAEDLERLDRVAIEAEAAAALLKQQAIDAQTPRDAPQVGGTDIGPAAQVGAPAQVQPIAPVVAPGAAGAAIDLGPQEEFRAEQRAAVADIRAASRGEVPSAADIQTRAAVERATANQLAAAQATGGRSVGGALRGATEGAAAQIADIESQGAARRAAEQQAARELLVTATGQARAQDIGVAQAQAELEQQIAIVNQDADLRAQVANQSTELQRQGLNVTEANKIALSNVIEQNKVKIEQGRLDQQTDLANQAATLQQLNLDDVKQLQTAKNMLLALSTSGQLAALPLAFKLQIEQLLLDEGFRRDQLAAGIAGAGKDRTTKLVGILLSGIAAVGVSIATANPVAGAAAGVATSQVVS